MSRCGALQIQALTWWLGSVMMSHACTSYLSSHKPLWIKTTEAQQSFTRVSTPCQARNLCQCLCISATTLDQHICSPSQPHKKEIWLVFYSSYQWSLLLCKNMLNNWNLTTKSTEDRVLIKLRVHFSRTFSMIKVKHGPKRFWEDKTRMVGTCTSSISLMSLVVIAPTSCLLQGSSSLQEINCACGWKRGDHLF